MRHPGIIPSSSELLSSFSNAFLRLPLSFFADLRHRTRRFLRIPRHHKELLKHGHSQVPLSIVNLKNFLGPRLRLPPALF